MTTPPTREGEARSEGRREYVELLREKVPNLLRWVGGIVLVTFVGGYFVYQRACGDSQETDNQSVSRREGSVGTNDKPVGSIGPGSHMSLTWVKFPETEIELDAEMCKPQPEEDEEKEDVKKELALDQAEKDESKSVSSRTMRSCRLEYYDKLRFDFSCRYEGSGGRGMTVFTWNKGLSTGSWRQPGMKSAGEWFLIELSPTQFAGWIQNPKGDKYSAYAEIVP
jgi:hypothetical protein